MTVSSSFHPGGCETVLCWAAALREGSQAEGAAVLQWVDPQTLGSLASVTREGAGDGRANRLCPSSIQHC